LAAALGAWNASAQTDVTYKIENPSFENGTDGWTVTDMSRQTNSAFTPKEGNAYMEKWTSSGGSVGSASVKQTVSNLVKGTYRLTAAAQNLQQGALTTAQTGAYIYGRNTSTKTDVTFAGDYSVDFSIVATSATIGYAAVSASGNWIACDNFRLTLLSVEPATVTSLAEKASGQLEKKLNDENRNKLTAAINAANRAVADNVEDLTGVAMTLQDTYLEAQANTKAYTTLKTKVSSSKLMLKNKMGQAEYDALTAAIAAGEAALEEDATDNDPVALYDALVEAYDNAKASNDAYDDLNTKITASESAFDGEGIGADTFAALLAEAKTMYENATASTAEVIAETEKLDSGLFSYRLANGEALGSSDLSATTYTKYVVTGATQALVRVTFSGSNRKEAGVCWSTEHNPTVLDSRTTKSFSQKGTLIHVKDLEPATVYYMRPYIMNTSYQVAYGEEVKVVTHPMGNCKGTWNEGAPTDEANTRCREAIYGTIDYFNEWTGIQGFTLTGNYGASTATADCSYGGWMRIGPNASYQAIGTVLHETAHGVGVGTHWRWYSCADTRENTTNGRWYGREANDILHFLENTDSDDTYVTGDATHGWATNASYDWWVNGADKDKHTEIQYIGGSALLYGLFIDGLCPTTGYENGIAGYTYNYDDAKKYYIMCKDASRGLGTGLLYARTTKAASWKEQMDRVVSDSAAWYIEYNAKTGKYLFRNAETGSYLSHASGITLKSTTSPTTTEQFQLMPDRTDVTVALKSGDLTTHGYWFTWNSKGMQANALGKTTQYGTLSEVDFNYSNSATKQQWIILSEEEMKAYVTRQPGDVNGDGEVSVSDITKIADIILNAEEHPYADVNEDGEISVSDITTVADIILRSE
jgi:hypothetical protein